MPNENQASPSGSDENNNVNNAKHNADPSQLNSSKREPPEIEPETSAITPIKKKEESQPVKEGSESPQSVTDGITPQKKNPQSGEEDEEEDGDNIVAAFSPLMVENPYMPYLEELYKDKCREKQDRSKKIQKHYQKEGKIAVERPCLKRDNFILSQELGRGSYGCVVRALNKTDGCFYALKIVNESSYKDRQVCLREVHAHAALGHHKNIVGYYSSWYQARVLYIQMQLCDHTITKAFHKGDLKAEDDYLDATYQLCEGLEYMHNLGVAHLDIKPDNIYVRDGIYKIGDFGRATLVHGDTRFEPGDGRYVCPFVLKKQREYTPKGDMFSLGVTLLELTVMSINEDYDYKLAVYYRDKVSQIREICSNRDIDVPGNFSDQFKGLIKSLLEYDPEERPSATDVLKNPIFEDIRKRREMEA